MVRRIALSLLALLAIGAALFFGFAPGWVEASMNKVDGKPLIPVSDEARALHATLTIVDLHSDTLMWNRSLVKQGSRGHEDLPRMQQGNVALQVFSSVTKTPAGLNYDRNSRDTRDNITPLVIAQLQPMRSWWSLAERSIWHARKLDRAVRRSQGALRKVADDAGLDALLAARRGATGTPPVGAILSIEGLHDLEYKRKNLDRMYDAGFRMASLTHFFDNGLAGSMHGVKKGGLTPFGREIVTAMEDKGMVVDIAHCSHACVAEVLAMARRPVISSHGGVQATCKVNRNLTDEEIRGIARTGGVIGIGYWEGAVCDTSPRATARAMKHVRDLVGIDYVALGSDYDGATTVRFDTSRLVQVTQALLDEGFSHEDIRKAMGLNALRVLRRGMIPFAQLPPAKAGAA
ncbi:MAG: dipeptidase [Sphingomonadales bacterium]|nr:dipeptidase [Sphingomonadales bacterium]MBD3774244.1 dipeptidase [Paracoccaceae bacterium]